MEHITVAGHPEPVPASPAAERLLRQRITAARDRRGDAAADALETLVGRRLGALLQGGMPSIDMATMRSVVDFVETPEEEEPAAGGLGRALGGIREKLSRRGMRSEG